MVNSCILSLVDFPVWAAERVSVLKSFNIILSFWFCLSLNSTLYRCNIEWHIKCTVNINDIIGINVFCIITSYNPSQGFSTQEVKLFPYYFWPWGDPWVLMGAMLVIVFCVGGVLCRGFWGPSRPGVEPVPVDGIWGSWGDCWVPLLPLPCFFWGWGACITWACMSRGADPSETGMGYYLCPVWTGLCAVC